MKPFGFALLSFMALSLFTANAQEHLHGYLCTQTCSGHEAGYNWADEHSVTDEADCNGNSSSFNEGCQAYVEENAGSSDEERSDDDE